MLAKFDWLIERMSHHNTANCLFQHQSIFEVFLRATPRCIIVWKIYYYACTCCMKQALKMRKKFVFGKVLLKKFSFSRHTTELAHNFTARRRKIILTGSLSHRRRKKIPEKQVKEFKETRSKNNKSAQDSSEWLWYKKAISPEAEEETWQKWGGGEGNRVAHTKAKKSAKSSKKKKESSFENIFKIIFPIFFSHQPNWRRRRRRRRRKSKNENKKFKDFSL